MKNFIRAWYELEKWVRKQIKDSYTFTAAFQEVLIKMLDLEKEASE
jgi:hypothetical protein